MSTLLTNNTMNSGELNFQCLLQDVANTCLYICKYVPLKVVRGKRPAVQIHWQDNRSNT